MSSNCYTFYANMGAYRDFIILMVIIVLLLALAVALLVVRDRRTLHPGMSAAERRRAIARNAVQTAHWWHVAGFAAIMNMLLFDRQRIPHQRTWALLVNAAVTAYFIFRYYRIRSEEHTNPVSPRDPSAPIQ
jgi:heme exporter protein D